MSTRLRRVRTKSAVIAVAALGLVGVAAAAAYWAGQRPRQITVDYPLEGSLFPPDFAPPTFEWRDASQNARTCTIDVSAGEGATPAVRATSAGDPPQIGEIDPEGIGPTNELPRLTPERAVGHAWKPDAATWETIRKISTNTPAVLTITGYSGAPLRRR